MEAGSPFEGLALIRQLDTSVGNDGLERFEIGDVFVDDRLVEDFPKMFRGLKFRRVRGQKEEADSVRNLQVCLPVPPCIVEYENNNAVAPGSGFLGESRQQLLERGLRDAVGNVPETFAGRGRDERRDIEPFEAVMPRRDRAHADGRPDPTHDWLQAEPVLVGGESFDGTPG